MIKKRPMAIALQCLFAVLILLTGVSSHASGTGISGSVQNGFRVLDIEPGKDAQTFTVYRGDYIKFVLPEGVSDTDGEFPTLKQNKPVTHELNSTAYFKMKKAGVHPFSIGAIKGQMNVIEYKKANYQEFTAAEASEYIKKQNPIILDVRTKREYQGGHIENANLLPVQELQMRMDELAKYKNEAILIYCATGNRSTVASKILIDAGFTDILNLRRGISDWARNQYPIVK
jgi:rhodanese-related sulfurtransferase